jgi:hypothetical protein
MSISEVECLLKRLQSLQMELVAEMHLAEGLFSKVSFTIDVE